MGKKVQTSWSVNISFCWSCDKFVAQMWVLPPTALQIISFVYLSLFIKHMAYPASETFHSF